MKTSKVNKKIITKAYQTQAISQPDSREEGSNIAIPSDENVEYNKHFVDENKKQQKNAPEIPGRLIDVSRCENKLLVLSEKD